MTTRQIIDSMTDDQFMTFAVDVASSAIGSGGIYKPEVSKGRRLLGLGASYVRVTAGSMEIEICRSDKSRDSTLGTVAVYFEREEGDFDRSRTPFNVMPLEALLDRKAFGNAVTWIRNSLGSDPTGYQDSILSNGRVEIIRPCGWTTESRLDGSRSMKMGHETLAAVDLSFGDAVQESTRSLFRQAVADRLMEGGNQHQPRLASLFPDLTFGVGADDAGAEPETLEVLVSVDENCPYAEFTREVMETQCRAPERPSHHLSM